jgi:hypothetical protein
MKTFKSLFLLLSVSELIVAKWKFESVTSDKEMNAQDKQAMTQAEAAFKQYNLNYDFKKDKTYSLNIMEKPASEGTYELSKDGKTLNMKDNGVANPQMVAGIGFLLTDLTVAKLDDKDLVLKFKDKNSGEEGNLHYKKVEEKK